MKTNRIRGCKGPTVFHRKCDIEDDGEWRVKITSTIIPMKRKTASKLFFYSPRVVTYVRKNYMDVYIILNKSETLSLWTVNCVGRGTNTVT